MNATRLDGGLKVRRKAQGVPARECHDIGARRSHTNGPSRMISSCTYCYSISECHAKVTARVEKPGGNESCAEAPLVRPSKLGM